MASTMSNNTSVGLNDAHARVYAGKNLFKEKTKSSTFSTTTTTPPTTLSNAVTASISPTDINGRVLVPEIDKVVTKAPISSSPNSTNIEYELCAPFPACNPIGCGDPAVAPIDCHECSRAATGGTIFGMFVLSVLIIIANLLVIRIILRTRSLRRRHGYIKLSLATSDLLVGLFVIPSAIGNLILTLYYPIQNDLSSDQEVTIQEHVLHLSQRNSTGSIVFGTIAVISVTTSLYNLLLLSADRFLAIARPMKHRSGHFFPKRSLWMSIGAVWVFGVSLSMVPGFIPKYFSYEMDLTTFFYIQRVGNSYYEGDSHSFSPYYIIIIIGGPYIATVVLNVLTMVFTWKSLQVRNRLSSRRKMSQSAIEKKAERNKRIKMLKQAYPEMMEDESSSRTSVFKGLFKKKTSRYSHSDPQELRDLNNERDKNGNGRKNWLEFWHSDDNIAKANTNSNNNESTDSERSQQSGQSPRFQRTRDQLHIVRDILNPVNVRNRARDFKAKHKTHVRVLKMIIAMVIAFTVCLLPYVIVTVQMSNGSLDCNNLTAPYTFALYMLFMNSGANFLIYNLWHPEFRHNLVKTFRNDYSKTTRFRKVASSVFTTNKGTESSTTYNTEPSTSRAPGDTLRATSF